MLTCTWLESTSYKLLHHSHAFHSSHTTLSPKFKLRLRGEKETINMGAGLLAIGSCAIGLCSDEHYLNACNRIWNEPSCPCCLSTTLCYCVHCSLCLLARVVIIYIYIPFLVLFYFIYIHNACMKGFDQLWSTYNILTLSVTVDVPFVLIDSWLCYLSVYLFIYVCCI